MLPGHVRSELIPMRTDINRDAPKLTNITKRNGIPHHLYKEISHDIINLKVNELT